MGLKKPCWNALPARALDPMWEPHMPPCISTNSSSPSSRGCTSISHRPASSCTRRHRRTGKGRPTVYFFRFFLVLRKLPCLEESDGMLAHAGAWGSTTRTKGISSAAGVATSMAMPEVLPELVALWQDRHPRQHLRRQLWGARLGSTCRGLASSACPAQSTAQWMVGLTEA